MAFIQRKPQLSQDLQCKCQLISGREAEKRGKNTLEREGEGNVKVLRFTMVPIKETQTLVDHSEVLLVSEQITAWSVFSKQMAIHFNE